MPGLLAHLAMEAQKGLVSGTQPADAKYYRDKLIPIGR